MDIVLITRDRPELTKQTISSMKKNAKDWSRHRLTVVFDGTGDECSNVFQGLLDTAIGNWRTFTLDGKELITVSITGKQLGVGGAKNFGVLEAHARLQTVRAFDSGRLLMFSDNDMYYLPGWDELLESAMHCEVTDGHSAIRSITQLGGWKHPFHASIKHWGCGLVHPRIDVSEVDAVTGNCFVIRWSDWMKYGPFDANAIGPGQSEDFAFSQRIKAGGGLVATLDPPVAIHCGLGNSEGKAATGFQEMMDMAYEQAAQWPNERFMLWMPKIRVENPHKWAKVEGFSTGSVAEAPPPDRTPAPTGEAQNSLEYDRSVKLSLNVGSGQRKFTSTPERQWINIDSQSILPDRVPDMLCDVGRQNLPFLVGQIDLVVLHHVLEHFGCGEGREMLQECWRVLRPGGSLLIFVPDMKALAGRWLGGELDDQLFFTNVYGAYMGDEADRHKWGFTKESLVEWLWKIFSIDITVYMFDWRPIPGADIARDWWILGLDVVKP